MQNSPFQCYTILYIIIINAWTFQQDFSLIGS